MKIELHFGNEKVNIKIDTSPEKVFVAKSGNPKPVKSWENLVEEALKEPVNSERLFDMNLNGKKIVILVDDKTRPTPAYRIVPTVIRELEKAGVRRNDISFVIASGLHEKTTTEEAKMKLGKEVANRYKVLVHDAFDDENLTFCGVSRYGTPIWVNRSVASADYRLAVGRITLHSGYGYEGGSKMILPGVSGCITVTHNHSMIPSPQAGYGTHMENPCRLDADDVAGNSGFGLHHKRGRQPQGGTLQGGSGSL